MLPYICTTLYASTLTSYTQCRCKSTTRLHLTKIPIALQKLLHIRPVLHRIHQLHQPRIFLQPLAPILNQLLIVADLIYNQVCICDLLADDEGTSHGELVGREVLLQRLEEGDSGALLMFGIILLFVCAEERCDEKGPPWMSGVSLNQDRKRCRGYVQSEARSHMASAQYFSSSLCPSYSPS